MAANGQVLLLCWYFLMSSLDMQPNRITDDEVNNKKPNRKCPAQTTEDRRDTDEK
jgi:hypothetical protein